MVFEYAELDLEIVVQSPVIRSLPEARVKSLLQQIMEGVDYLHHNKIMHRDLKPSNCLVTRKGDVKICDFGLVGRRCGIWSFRTEGGGSLPGARRGTPGRRRARSRRATRTRCRS